MKILRRFQRQIAWYCLTVFGLTFVSFESSAVTGGPSTPEASGFSGDGGGNMVDPFTGDFNYSIPLLEVGGYPVSMQYKNGMTAQDDGSWVGCGWSLNLGSVNRSIRGIADDYMGDQIETEHHIKPNETFGLTFQPPTQNGRELFTFKTSISQNFNISYNSYNGLAFSYSYSPSLDISLVQSKGDSPFDLGVKPSATLSIGSEEGVGVSPKVGVSVGYGKNNTNSTLNTTVGFPYSSREGAKGISLGTSFDVTKGPAPPDYAPALQSGGGINRSAFKGFSTPTYPTFINHNTFAVNATLNLNPEKVESILTDKSRFLIGGYYSGQFQESEVDNNPAYGYMYEGANSDPNAVQDFNREKDGGFNLKTTNMPVTNHTHDVFSVSGSGVGGTFRLFRDDVAHVGDNASTSTTISPDLAIAGGFKGGFLSTLKVGVDFKYVQSNSRSGRWSNIDRVQHFDSPFPSANDLNRNVYFGQVGDLVPERDMAFLNNVLRGDELYKYRLINGFVTGQYENKSGAIGGLPMNGSNGFSRAERPNQSLPFTYFTAGEAEKYSYQKYESFPENGFSSASAAQLASTNTKQNSANSIYFSDQEFGRTEGFRKAHHLSEVHVTNNGGARYIYGIPVYNTQQKDVTFSVNAPANNASLKQDGLIGYSLEDASTGNKQGLEHYYKKTSLPAYTTSFLISQMLSPDYVDSDDIEGVSDGDLGNYVKFNYTRTSDDYRWRAPFQKDKATYAEGLQGKRNDDKGSYTYGTKELWYVHTIESRTHVAEFYLKDRFDGIGAFNEHGGLGVSSFADVPEHNKQKCLDKIVLYAKRDKLNGKQEPLKTVHFDYDYSLCEGTPNSLAPNGGKLTLRKVWFTYGNSNKGVENPYEFFYGDEDLDGVPDPALNLPYAEKSTDRWGTYMEPHNGQLNDEFPYTNSNKVISDVNAAMYAMTRILSPNGGDTRIHYEADDYAHVQNRRAMRMFKTIGVAGNKSDPVSSASDNLYSSTLGDRPYLFVDLGDGIEATSPTDALEIFKNEYLRDVDELRYRADIGVWQPQGALFPVYENVTGFCLINKDELAVTKKAGSNNYDVGVIKLELESLNPGSSNSIHPFVKNGWLFARMQYNRELMGSMSATDPGMMQILGTIASSINSVISFIFGFRTYMKTGLHSKKFNADRSMVLLNEPDGVKVGGGSRVKAIVTFDRWNEMISDREGTSSLKETSGYGQVYDYTKPIDPTNLSLGTISSGVAAYEPILGGEENPIRRLVKTQDKVPMAPDKEFYKETPFGESMLPAPVVGYSMVKTIPVKIPGTQYDVDMLQGNGTGFTQEEFYTAKDFPSRVSQTNLTVSQDKSSDLNPLKFKSYDHVRCSQGYKIELNDMHGKPKSTKVMPDVTTGDAFPVSMVSYKYRTDQNDPTRLYNKVPLVDQSLNYSLANQNELGTTVDVVNDTRYYESDTRGGGADVNVRVSWTTSFPPIIIPVITAFPDINIENTSFSSITTTKVVNRYGILEKTTVFENGASLSTDNLAWDAETGQVLLSRVENEFENDIYKFVYPAHWAYEEMGLSAQNEGLKVTNLSTAQSAFVEGDELVGEEAGSRFHAYYMADQNKFIKKDGSELAETTQGVLIRSGARNTAQIEVASVSSLDNPVVGNSIDFSNARVLQTGASEFSNRWKGFCNCGEQSLPNVNPFVSGQRGQLRPYRSWTYLTGRAQNLSKGEPDIGDDGYLEDYSAFWLTGGSLLQPHYNSIPLDQSRWQFVEEVENFNPLGLPVESQDPLNRHTMTQYGYGRALMVGKSDNSQYGETGFDGFEDYHYEDCNDDHFSWRSQTGGSVSVTPEQSHTGGSSLKVAPGANSKIVKNITPCQD